MRAETHGQPVQLPERCWSLTTTAPGHGGQSADLLLCAHFPSREDAAEAGLEALDGDHEVTPAARAAIATVLAEGARQGAEGCWVVRCRDCGQELRDEDGQGCVQHYRDAAAAREGAADQGWPVDLDAYPHGDLLCPRCDAHSGDALGGALGDGTPSRHERPRPGRGQLVLVQLDGPWS